MIRRLIALLALLGVFLGAYLTLYKFGYIGTLACGVSSCETVQMSRWSTFLGLPVSLGGLGFYASLFGLALAGLSERYAESPGVSRLLLVSTGWGMLFTGYLNYIEGFVLHAWCQWCIISAVLVALLFGLAVADVRATRTSGEGHRGFLRPFDIPRLRPPPRLVQPQRGTLVHRAVARRHRPPPVVARPLPVRHQILPQHHQRARRHRARQRLRHRHLPDVRIDRPIEGQIFRQRVHEHQRVVHMRPDDRLLRPGLRQPHAAFGGGFELALEDAFREEAAEKGEHGGGDG
jgi:uncharacterized membrane protein